MTPLQDLVEDEFRTSDAELAVELAREDQHLLAELVSIRKRLGLSQEEVADTLGLSQATISSFERVGNDPHLSTVRRYARALGVMIRHHIDQEGRHGDSHFISHVSSAGVSSRDTASAVARALRHGGSAWPKEATRATSPVSGKVRA